jgi:hypothetical protein
MAVIARYVHREGGQVLAGLGSKEVDEGCSILERLPQASVRWLIEVPAAVRVSEAFTAWQCMV